MNSLASEPKVKNPELEYLRMYQLKFHSLNNKMTDICGQHIFVSVFGSHVDCRDWNRDGFVIWERFIHVGLTRLLKGKGNMEFNTFYKSKRTAVWP